MKEIKSVGASKLIRCAHGGDYYVSTVGDLIDFLSKFDKAMPVLAEWEGQFESIDDGGIKSYKHAFSDEVSDVLVLDVDHL